MDDDWGYPYYLGNHQSHLPFPLSPFRVNVCVGSCSCLVLSGLQDRLGTASKGELLREVASWRKSHIRKWWQIKSGTITEHIWYLSLILLYLSFVELLNTSSVSAFGELTIEKKKWVGLLRAWRPALSQVGLGDCLDVQKNVCKSQLITK